MLDILRDYLDTATTPEEKRHIDMADRFLERIQDENYEHVIEEILMLDQDMDTGVPLASIVAVYRQQLHYFFTQHALTINDELSLMQLTDIANGLLDLIDHEQLAELIERSVQEAPVAEQVCELLVNTTRYSADELLQMVDEVAESFLVRLKGLAVTVEDNSDDADLLACRERLHSYRKYQIYLGSVAGQCTAMEHILRNGGGADLPYLYYAKLLDSHQALESLPRVAAAQELFAAALVSSDGYSNPLETIKASLEQFIIDPKTIADVMVEVRQILMGYNA